MKTGLASMKAWATACLALSLALWGQAAWSQKPHPGLMHAPHERVMQALDDGQAQELLVVFDDTVTQQSADELMRGTGHTPSHWRIRAHRVAALQEDKDRVLEQVESGDWHAVRHHSQLPVSVIRFRSRSALENWMATPGVLGIYENQYETRALAASLPLISQPQAAAAGQLGAGTAVAVLDTGVNYARPEFGNCTAPGLPSSCKVVYAQDFAADDGSLDADGHGTNVAAIVLGVAPATKIISLDVFGSSGTSSVSDQIRAIDWVIANQSKYNIVAMNLSLGGGKYLSSTSADPRKVAFDTARAAGILTVAAAGNEGYSNGLAVPAAITGVISVGAVYDAPIGSRNWNTSPRCTDTATKADQVTCFSNSASFLTLLAPGAMITAGGSTMPGTSQAAPHVAGAVAVLRSAFPNESLDQTVTRLTTGVQVTDARNDVSKPRLDLKLALGSASACSYALSASQIALSGQGGSGSVAVSTTAKCGWMAGVAASNSSWITISAGSSGSGNGSVAFSVSANPNAQARTGTISVAGLTYTVIQQAASTARYNLLTNPNFESGDANWTQSAANGMPIIVSQLNTAGSKTTYAWLCGYDNCVDILSQDVSIPADAVAATLQFQYQISTEETSTSLAYDKLQVSVHSPPGNAVAALSTTLSNLNSKSAWTTSQPLDLTAFKGSTVRIQFSGLTDASLTTSFYLDEIQLNVSGAQADTQAPTIPTGVTARINGSNSITLSWSAASDNIGVHQYRIYRNALLLDTIDKSALSYTDRSVAPASAYTYSVVACDVAGNCSAPSTGLQVSSASILTDGEPPSIPTGLNASALSQTSIRLTWTAATDNVAVTAYKIYRNGSLLTTATSGTAYSDANLTPSTPYSYTVTACDAAGNCSAQSLAALVYTQSPPNLSPIVFSGTSSFQVNGNSVGIKINEIRNTRLSGHSGSLRLELWALTAPYNGGQVTGYVTASIRTADITGLSDYLNALRSFTNISLNLPYTAPPSTHKTYALFVTEYSPANCTQADKFCIVNYINFREAVPPTVPVLQGASPLNSAQVKLTWAPSTDASGISSYQIYRDGVMVAQVGNVSSYTDGGLNPSSTYRYGVAACDVAQNCSAASAALSATTLAFQDVSAPTVPTGLSGTIISSTSVRLSWNASTDNLGVVNYKLYTNGVFVADLGNTLSATRTNAPATTYNYALAACDAAGNCSARSATLTLATPALVDAQPPSVPGSLVARSDSPSTVSLSWAAATDNLGVTQYKVFRGNSLLTTVGAVTTYLDTGLKSATAYAYKVQACDSAGNCSDASLSASVTTQSSATTTTTATTTATTTTTTTTSTSTSTTTTTTKTSAPPTTTTSTTSTTSTTTTTAPGPALNFVKGWNLVGNGYATTVEVAQAFGDKALVVSVWKWLADKTAWAFYAPSLSSDQLQTYAQGKGYEVLSTINAGEGFWVNAAKAWSASPQTAGLQPVDSGQFTATGAKALPKGWNLIATGDKPTPAGFNQALSLTPPSPGVIPDNLISLWAWEAEQAGWQFYAPSLQRNNTLDTYIQGKGYLPFGSKTLSPSTGFWVNRP